MVCCGSRDKLEEISKEQQWDWLNLSDFRSHSCLTPLSYGILYISLLISIACYCIDLFTAVNLLARDTWSGIVKPAIPIYISRWIFAGCIILSWVLLAYRWLQAVRAMRSGGVAQSYLDPLAVRIQSIRMGARGRGWRRFLVFAELTKNKKGSEYVALFCHYSFEAWMRILFAEGPRNAINAMTLYSVMQANLLPTGAHAAGSGQSPILQFFSNLMTLADSNRVQAAVLFGMLFTLIIWVISFLSLAIACIFYVLFLWHHIPSQDGGLYSYCKRKVDRRLQKIVGIKVNKALAKEDAKRSKEDPKAGDRPLELKRQPTVPNLNTDEDDKLPVMPMLSRQTSEATLPPYNSRPATGKESSESGLERNPTVPDVSLGPTRPVPPSRSNTQYSASSDATFASNTPLMTSAGPMGHGPAGRAYSPGPLSRMGSDRTMASERPLMGRSGTDYSQASARSNQSGCGPQNFGQDVRPIPPSRQNTPYDDSQFQGRSTSGPPSRQNTGQSDYQSQGRSTPGPPHRQNTNTSMSDFQSNGQPNPGPPTRQNTGMSDNSSDAWSGPGLSQAASQGRRTPKQILPVDSYRRNSPIPQRGPQQPLQQYEMRSQPHPARAIRPNPSEGHFMAYNPSQAPNMSSQAAISTASGPHRDFNPSPTHRNFSAPLRSARQPQPPQRSGTAPLPQTATYDDSIYDIYGGDEEEQHFTRPSVPARAATAGPDNGRWNGQTGYRPNAYDSV